MRNVSPFLTLFIVLCSLTKHTMIIQLNTDNNIENSSALIAYFETLVAKDLERFSQHISRIEAHLSDEVGNKNGAKDIRCVLEARIEGRSPLAVTNIADTREKAIDGAINKIKSSLDSIIGKLNSH